MLPSRCRIMQRRRLRVVLPFLGSDRRRLVLVHGLHDVRCDLPLIEPAEIAPGIWCEIASAVETG